MADNPSMDEKARDELIKRLVKEAIAEYVTEAEKTRTEAAAKNKDKGLFGALFQ